VSAGPSEYDVERRPLLASGRAEPKYCIIDDTRLGLVLIRRRFVSTRFLQITWTPPAHSSREHRYEVCNSSLLTQM